MLSFSRKNFDILAVVLQNRDVLFADSKIKIRATEGSQNQAKSNDPFTSEILFWRSKKKKTLAMEATPYTVRDAPFVTISPF